MPKTVNVLFTSVGRRVELMQAFRRAFDALGLDGAIAATDIDTLAPALQAVDRPFLVPRLDDPDYMPALARIIEEEKIDLVFPLIDPDIPALARHRTALEAAGARLVVSPDASIARSNDKWETYTFFKEAGVPTAESWLPGQVDPDALDYPVFVKPRQGSASQHTHRADDAEALAFYVRQVPDPIIQELLPGPETTNDVICTLEPDGEVLGVSSRRRIEVRWGEVAKGVTVKDPAILEGCVKVARAFRAMGPITVQCMEKDGVQHFTEINARFGGGAPLGVAAGVDAPRWLLARHAGIPVDVPPLGAFTEGLYLTRYDTSFFLTDEDRDRIARRGL